MDPTAAIAPEPAPAGWPTLVPGDYAVGVVRLVTLIHQKVSHLLFASVELLPTEMPVPPPPPNGGWSKNFGGDRLCVGRTVLPWADALAWYETLKLGQAVVPGKAFPIAAARLGSEPDYRGFTVLADPPPFSPVWHGRPRLHRLIPMEDLAEPVRALRDGSVEVEALIRAREWLRQHVHFDLLAYDDWLGSGVLIAPNPLLRSFGARIVDRTATPETLELGGTPRRGANVSSLRMTVEEVRAGASAWRADGAPNALGRFRAPAQSQVAAVREELVCSVRGILDREPPAVFFRNVSVSVAQVAEARANARPPLSREPSLCARRRLLPPRHRRRRCANSRSCRKRGPSARALLGRPRCLRFDAGCASSSMIGTRRSRGSAGSSPRRALKFCSSTPILTRTTCKSLQQRPSIRASLSGA